MERYTVGLVLDPEFGERLVELAARIHVWISDTPTNRATTIRVWESQDSRSIETGVTIFTVPDNYSPEDACIRELPAIELHHGEYSHDPPYSALEVIGTPLANRIKEGFAEYGFDEFHQTEEGFIALKAVEGLQPQM